MKKNRSNVTVSLYVRTVTFNSITFDTYLWRAGSFDTLGVQFEGQGHGKFQGHRMKSIAKEIDATSNPRFTAFLI